MLNFGAISLCKAVLVPYRSQFCVSPVKAAFGWTNDFPRIFALDPAPRDCPWLLRQEVLSDAKLSRKYCSGRVSGMVISQSHAAAIRRVDVLCRQADAAAALTGLVFVAQLGSCRAAGRRGESTADRAGHPWSWLVPAFAFPLSWALPAPGSCSWKSCDSPAMFALLPVRGRLAKVDNGTANRYPINNTRGTLYSPNNQKSG